MQQWEYCVEYLAHRGHDSGYDLGTKVFDKMLWQQDLEKTLNKFGSQGWELVSFPEGLLSDCVDGFAVFKRPKED